MKNTIQQLLLDAMKAIVLYIAQGIGSGLKKVIQTWIVANIRPKRPTRSRRATPHTFLAALNMPLPLWVVFIFVVAILIARPPWPYAPFVNSGPSTTAKPAPTAYDDATTAYMLYDKVIHKRMPSLYASLADQDSNKWSNSTDGTRGCQFQNAAYHVWTHRPGDLNSCTAPISTSGYYALQVTTQSNVGDSFGVVTTLQGPADNAPQYLFQIIQSPNQSSYGLTLMQHGIQKKFSCANYSAYCYAPAIHAGARQLNTLTIIAERGQVYFFVNTTFVKSWIAGTANVRGIGFFANYYQHATDVIFGNLQVWQQLPSY